MSDTAIDFAKLLKLEKLRLRRKLEEDSKCNPTQSHRDDSSGTDKIPIHYFSDASRLDEIDSIPHILPSTSILLNKNCLYYMSSSFCDVYYIENFLGEQFSDCIVTWLNSLPFVEKDNLSDPSAYHGKWTRLKHSNRNVALFDLKLSTHFILGKLVASLMDIQAFPFSHPPNHVLVNEYQGHEGIMPHTDGPSYFHRTATFSIGPGDVLFSFTPRKEPSSTPVFQIRLKGKGSLIVFGDDAYSNYCHGINDRVDSLQEYANSNCVNCHQAEAVMRGYRISLTFRHKYVDDFST